MQLLADCQRVPTTQHPRVGSRQKSAGVNSFARLRSHLQETLQNVSLAALPCSAYDFYMFLLAPLLDY